MMTIPFDTDVARQYGPNAAAVLGYLRSHRDQNNEVEISAGQVGVALGLARGTVNRALATLEGAGYITRLSRRFGGGGRWRVN